MSLPTTETSGDARGTSGGEPVKTLSRRFFQPPTASTINRHKHIRGRYEAMRITGPGWAWICIASLIIGLGVYGGIVAFSYWHTANAMQTSRASFSMSWKPGITTETAATVTLDDLGIAGDNDLKKELIAAIGLVRANAGSDGGPSGTLPALGLATQLIKATETGSCGTCQQDCSVALQPVLTRMLLGWPTTSGSRAADVSFLHARNNAVNAAKPPVVGDQNAKDKACKAVVSLESLAPSISPGLLWGRQEPWPSPLTAQLVLGADNCVGNPTQLSRDRCLLVTRLFQTVIDDVDIKNDRAFLVDFFYGWERALVSVLVFIVALALRRQRRARQRLELEASWVQSKIENKDLRIGLDPTDPTNSIAAPAAATALRDSFIEIFSPQFDGTAQEPVAEIVAAAAEAVTQEDLQYMQTFVDRNIAEMEVSRELINSIITIFPVIGFSATLLSLVHALSGANQIATSSGDLRSAAILNVTSLLSSCFATTFLALVAMAIFVVLNLLEGNVDKRLLTTLSERLISTFRPGRKY